MGYALNLQSLGIPIDNTGSTTSGDVVTNYYNFLQIDQSGGTSDTNGVLAGSINGSNQLFTTSNGSYISGSLSVYLNGQLLTQGSSEDWTETDPSSGTFTLASAPLAGDDISTVYITQESTGGAVITGYVSKSTTYTALTSDHIIDCTGTFTLTLFTATTVGQELIIKNSGAGTITIDGNASETIDGDTSITLDIQYESVTLIADGTNWKIV